MPEIEKDEQYRVQAYIGKQEKDKLERLCKRYGLSQSACIRLLINQTEE